MFLAERWARRHSGVYTFTVFTFSDYTLSAAS